MELNAVIHFEDDAYWAEVKELPGCFASGRTLDELNEALREAVFLYLENDAGRSRPTRRSKEPRMQVNEMKLLVSA